MSEDGTTWHPDLQSLLAKRRSFGSRSTSIWPPRLRMPASAWGRPSASSSSSTTTSPSRPTGAATTRSRSLRRVASRTGTASISPTVRARPSALQASIPRPVWTLDLFDSDGSTLIDSGTASSNLSSVIDRFVDTTSNGSADTYYARVSISGGEYNLLVTRSATFDTERSNDSAASPQLLSGFGGGVGARRGRRGRLLPHRRERGRAAGRAGQPAGQGPVPVQEQARDRGRECAAHGALRSQRLARGQRHGHLEARRGPLRQLRASRLWRRRCEWRVLPDTFDGPRGTKNCRGVSSSAPKKCARSTPRPGPDWDTPTLGRRCTMVSARSAWGSASAARPRLSRQSARCTRIVACRG